MKQELLVARHEVKVRFSSKIVLFTLLSLFIIIAIVPWVPRLMNSNGVKSVKIGIFQESGFVFQAESELEFMLKNQGIQQGMKLDFIAGKNLSELKKQSKPKKFGAILGLRESNFNTYVVDASSVSVISFLKNQAQSLAISNFMEEHHLSTSSLTEYLQNSSGAVTTLGDGKKGIDFSKLVISLAELVLLYSLVLMAGSSLAMGVVEEKASKVMEVILSSIRPRQLLIGKIIGISVFVILQFVLLVSIGLISAEFAGVLHNIHLSLGVMFICLLWFMPAFLFFSVLYVGFGANVSRLEDIGAVQSPLMILLTTCFYAGMYSVTSGDNLLVKIFAYIPPFSFFIEPPRILIHSNSFAEQFVSWLIAVFSTFLVAKIGFILFERSILGSVSRKKSGSNQE